MAPDAITLTVAESVVVVEFAVPHASNPTNPNAIRIAFPNTGLLDVLYAL
jgi:hypothetical protein